MHIALTLTKQDTYHQLCEQVVKDLQATQAPTSSSMTVIADRVSPEDHPWEQIGPFQAVYHASGVSSTVYRARDPQTSEVIAIKLTTPSQMCPPHNSYKEARILRLSKSQSIIPIVSSMPIAGGHFLLAFPFMPFDFSTLLQRRVLSAFQVRAHLTSLFQALSHIHSRFMIHRDVKPSNLLLASPHGPAYLADFGIAWHGEDPDSEPSNEKITDVGSTCYRPPELLFGNSCYTEALDMWAAGCVVAEAVEDGKSLFEAGDVGSELALIRSIFTTLGTPTDESWPVGTICARSRL